MERVVGMRLLLLLLMLLMLWQLRLRWLPQRGLRENIPHWLKARLLSLHLPADAN